MQYTHLEAFLALVDTGSLSDAAERMYVAQSTMSMLLASLEKEVGRTLIIRKRGRQKRLTPTEEGWLFYEYARNVLHSYDQLMIQFNQLNSKETRPLNIATGQTLAVTLIAPMLKSLHKENSNIKTNVTVKPMSNLENIYTALKTPDCDFVIATREINDEHYVSELFLSDPFVLICNRSLKTTKNVSLSDLQSLPLVLREPTCDTMITLSNALQKKGLSISNLNSKLSVYGVSAVRDAVKNGSLCGFVPLSAYHPGEDIGQIKVVDIPEFDNKRNIYLIYRKNVHLRPEARLLRRFILSKKWNIDMIM